MSVHAILFDKDGTLIDFDRTWGPAVQSILQQLACGDAALYGELCTVSGLQDDLQFRPTSPLIGEPTSVFGAIWAKVLRRSADAEFFGEIDRLLCAATTANLVPIGDPKAVLDDLAVRGYRLGLITNDSEASARAHARKLGLDLLLAFIVGYDSGFGVKPAPGPLLAFAAAVGVPASEIVVVGDTALDVMTARAGGAQAVMVLTGPKTNDWQAAKPDAVIPSIAQLSAWLARPIGPK